MAYISDIYNKDRHLCCIRKNQRPRDVINDHTCAMYFLLGIYATCYVMNYKLACLITMTCIQLAWVDLFVIIIKTRECNTDMDSSTSSESSDTSNKEEDELDTVDSDLPDLIPLESEDDLPDLIRLESEDDLPDLIPLDSEDGPNFIDVKYSSELSQKQVEQGGRIAKSMTVEQENAFNNNAVRLVKDVEMRNMIRVALDTANQVDCVLSDEHYIDEYLKNYN